MASGGLQIIHKRKGMKGLIQRIALLQMYYVTSGIHRNEGRKIVPSGAKKRPKDGMVSYRNIFTGQTIRCKPRDLPDYVTWENGWRGLTLKDPNAPKKERKRSEEPSGRKKRINIATLAYYLEKTISWVQKKTAIVDTHDGGKVNIWKGARLKRPARIFIHINLLDNIWKGIRSLVRLRVRLILSKRAGSTKSKNFWNAIGSKVLEEQKARITRKDTTPNSQLTEKIKGFNHPLFNTGALLNSLKFKVVKNFTNANKKIQKLKYLNEIDSWVRELNRK